MMMFNSAKLLTQKGVLGMNRRNAEFIQLYNKRSRYPLVDDKLKTKQLAMDAGIAVPDLYGVIEINQQLRELPAILAPHQDFVIKPAHGAGGDGIMVITGKRNGIYIRASGKLIENNELEHYVSNVLSGMYSLGGHPDKAMIEYRVQFDPMFEKVSYQGVPDIRTVVFKGYPVMAMVRLPTRQSDGKANLHQGAIGTGIDLATGLTTSAVLKNKIIDEHPDYGQPVQGLQIPQWEKLLHLAARCYELSGLGYLGVDVVLDKNKGPLILELNARPGLNIQIANRRGLVPVLRQVEALSSIDPDPAARVEYAMQNFAM